MSPSQSPSSCPDCGTESTGNFCQNCGADLGGRFCNQCGEKTPVGSKFCNQCGATVGGAVTARSASGGASRGARKVAAKGAAHRDAAAATVGGENLPWWIAGGAMFVLILFVGLSMVRPGGPAPPAAATPTSGATVAGTGAPPDISNMSPIEAADRLFNRVMQATSSGDSAQAQAFMPMAIAAYQRAQPLSLDGLFHLSMLNRTAMNLEAALADALDILDQDPNHLLGLAAAAEAALEMGDLDEAEKHYRVLAEVYDAESQEPVQEYADHSMIVERLKDDAEQFLAAR